MRVQAFLLVLVVTTFQALIVSVPLVMILGGLELGIWLLCLLTLFIITTILFLAKSSKEEFEEQLGHCRCKNVLW
jgi:hypothetical protein